MKRVNAKIHGFVQKVGFRNFVRRHAERLGITGWIRNNHDGTVEAVFEGDDDAVTQMINKCKKGPLLALVEDVKVTEEDLKNEFQTFEILK
ncbi:MAG: acylphosphatase [Candidatus Aenigmarchaeota archaeon]|nr:acylphosphatase [Candidatus Aenigmarchaeota archaeon]